MSDGGMLLTVSTIYALLFFSQKDKEGRLGVRYAQFERMFHGHLQEMG
jgi:hypothetical protein